MKKFASILLIAVLLATMLSVFAVPASALDLSGTIDNDGTYEDEVYIIAPTTVASGKKLVFNRNLHIMSGGTMTVEPNAAVTANSDLSIVGNLTVNSGAEVTANSVLRIDGNLAVNSGATVAFFKEFFIHENATVKIRGTLKGEWSSGLKPRNTEKITLSDGGRIEIIFQNKAEAESFADGITKYKKTFTDENEGKCLLTVENPAHIHDFSNGVCSCGEPCPHRNWENGVCSACGYVCPHIANECVKCHAIISGGNVIGSALSEGSLTIICIVAAAVVFGLGGFFIGRKKKKPALAGGENTGEE